VAPASVLSHRPETNAKKEGKEFVKFVDGLANVAGTGPGARHKARHQPRGLEGSRAFSRLDKGRTLIDLTEVFGFAFAGFAAPLPVRIRCAVEALPYENPKLSAVTVASMTGNEFAMRLDRAIMRSGKLIEAKAVEPQRE
jgi:hypothetical protein